MKIWLDDIRPMPAEYDLHVKTAQEAITALKENVVTDISLDHDLGKPENGTGYDVASWIEVAAYHNWIQSLNWKVHSANPVGSQNITNAMRSAERFWKKNSS